VILTRYLRTSRKQQKRIKLGSRFKRIHFNLHCHDRLP